MESVDGNRVVDDVKDSYREILDRKVKWKTLGTWGQLNPLWFNRWASVEKEGWEVGGSDGQGAGGG